MTTDKTELVQKVKLTEQAECYDGMTAATEAVIDQGHEPSNEERNLLSVTYENVVGVHGSSQHVTSALEGKQRSKKQPHLAKRTVRRRRQRGRTPARADELWDKHPIISDIFLRWRLEIIKQTTVANSQQAYQEAFEISKKEMQPVHPVRLGLPLKFSTFHCEILNPPEKACSLAHTVFDEAVAELDTLDAESYKDSTLIVQLLRDNLCGCQKTRERKEMLGRERTNVYCAL